MTALASLGLAATVLVGAPQAVASTPTDQVGLVDTAESRWHIRSAEGAVVSFVYGDPGDAPMMGDWDCDGIDTPGLYRRSDGFVYLRNSNTQGNADIRFFFGDRGDIPLAGDFDGDGCDTVSVYRPSQARVFIVNELGDNDGGLGAAELDYVFGDAGDKPFVGDFDGDGVDTVGLHRESTGLVYFRQTHTQGNADAEFFFGDPGDRLVSGDWNQDGSDTPALFRPEDTTFYFRYTNTQGVADEAFPFGDWDWLPVSGTVDLDAAPTVGSLAASACTEVLGFSQTGQWFAHLEAEGWQGRIKGGVPVEGWADPGFEGWSAFVRHPQCSHAEVRRVVFTVSGDPRPAQEWAEAVLPVVQIIRDTYPAVDEIVLQPVVGGPNHGECLFNNAVVRATSNHPVIDAGIALAAAMAEDVRAGASPTVSACDDYRDRIGHLTDAGAVSVAAAIAESYGLTPAP